MHRVHTHDGQKHGVPVLAHQSARASSITAKHTTESNGSDPPSDCLADKNTLTQRQGSSDIRKVYQSVTHTVADGAVMSHAVYSCPAVVKVNTVACEQSCRSPVHDTAAYLHTPRANANGMQLLLPSNHAMPQRKRNLNLIAQLCAADSPPPAERKKGSVPLHAGLKGAVNRPEALVREGLRVLVLLRVDPPRVREPLRLSFATECVCE